MALTKVIPGLIDLAALDERYYTQSEVDAAIVAGSGGVQVNDDGVTTVDVATILDFIGTGVTVTDAGAGTASITISAGPQSVDSVFGRTGTVAATSGDYNLDQIDDGSTYVRITSTEQTKLAGIEGSADVTDAANVAAAGAVMEGDTSTAFMSFVIDDDSMATASDTTLATSESVKAYVDSQVVPDGDKGDVTVSSSGTVWTINGNTVSYAKMQNTSAASVLLGRGAASGAGDPEEITLGTNITMSGTTLNVSTGTATLGDGDYSDVTVSSSGTEITINDNAVSNAKAANMATSRIKGRITAGTGDPEDLTPAQVHAMINVIETRDATGGITLNANTITFVSANDGSNVTLPASGGDYQQAVYNRTGSALTVVRDGSDTVGLGTTYTIGAGQGARFVIEAGLTNWVIGFDYTGDAAIASAYAGEVGQVSSGEITAGTETALRTYAPEDIVAFIDQHSIDVTVDDANYSVNFLEGSASFLEAGLTGAYVTQGTASFPNRQGDDTNVIQGTGYDGTHVAGALWRVADSSYVAASVDYAGILGGYDCLNNQIGGWISGSNHSVLNYNAGGHSYIAGGSYNFIESGRSSILGSTACAITGSTDLYSAIVAGRESLIDDAAHSLVVGRGNVLNASSADSLIVGQDCEVRASHPRATLLGRDANSMSADTFTRGSEKLVTKNDVRVWSKIFKKRTTNATIANMDVLPETFEAGKVYAGYVKIKLIGLHDDGANGDGGNTFNHCVFEGETSFMWDEDSDHGNFNGGSNVSGPTFNLTPVGIDKIGVGTCQLAMNTGLLRPKVTGKTATTINWVAEMEVISTAAAS